MATKKGATAKRSGKTKRSKKSTARKAGARKSLAQSSTKKSSKSVASAKKTAPKGAAKPAAKKAAAKKATALAAAGPCTLTAPGTTLLVFGCAPQAHEIGSTLSQAGIDNANQRRAFRDCVFQRVLDAGCVIDRSVIPHEPDTTLRDVVFAILDAI